MKIVIEILDGEITQIVSVNNGDDTNLKNKSKALSKQNDDLGITDIDTGPASFITDDISEANKTKNNLDLNNDVSAGSAPEIP